MSGWKAALLGRGLLTPPLTRPQVSQSRGRPAVGAGARSGDRAPTGRLTYAVSRPALKCAPTNGNSQAQTTGTVAPLSISARRSILLAAAPSRPFPGAGHPPEELAPSGFEKTHRI